MSPRMAAAAALLLSCLLPLRAQSGASIPGDLVLRHEFWCEYEPHPASQDGGILSPEEVSRRLSEEAAWVFSGMVRGFAVVWTPADAARGVRERLSIKPLGPVDTASGDLRVIESRLEGTRLLVYVEYRPNPAEAALYDSWRESSYPVAGGLGKARETGGTSYRIKAMEDAIRSALNAYARESIPNRPRQVLAVAAFEGPPLMDIEAGLYTARVRVRLRIDEVRPYSAY